MAAALIGVVLFLPGVISDDTAAHDLSADVEKVVDKPARAGRLREQAVEGLTNSFTARGVLHVSVLAFHAPPGGVFWSL